MTNVNEAPTTSAVTLAAIAEDSGVRVITAAELLANAEDVEGDTLTVSGLGIVGGNGTLVDNGNGTWSYTPASNDDTSVSFGYTITDDGTTNGGADPKSVAGSATLDITPVNDAPTLGDTTNPAVAELGSATAQDLAAITGKRGKRTSTWATRSTPWWWVPRRCCSTAAPSPCRPAPRR